VTEARVAIVTGASRGIGQAIARTLTARGLRVAGTATTVAGAERIGQDLAEHGEGIGLQLDVTDAAQVDAVVAEVNERLGAPLVLVNNAGITRDNLLMRMKPEEWDAIIDTNLSAVYRMSRACLRGMMKARWGRIISVASVVGVTGNPGQTNYSAAKAGMIGFTKSLAQEIGSRGITVNVVAPGFIDTDMTRALEEDQRKVLMGKIPLGRLGAPEDLADAVAFLSSENASYITGETLHVNGGMYMS
jgi:3-oxoacyl-[acyl-carrier protein] reductase